MLHLLYRADATQHLSATPRLEHETQYYLKQSSWPNPRRTAESYEGFRGESKRLSVKKMKYSGLTPRDPRISLMKKQKGLNYK
jgi:hypothetical protein